MRGCAHPCFKKVPCGFFEDDYLLGREAKVGGGSFAVGAADAKAKVGRALICFRSTQRQKAFFYIVMSINRKENEIYMNFSSTFFINTNIVSREAHLAGRTKNGADRFRAPLEHKRNRCQSNSSEPCDHCCHFPLFLPFLWAFLAEVARGFLLACECGGGKEPGGHSSDLEKNPYFQWLLPLPFQPHKRILLRFQRSEGAIVATCQLQVYSYQQGED